MKFENVYFLSFSLPDDVKREEDMGNFKVAREIIGRYMRRKIDEELRKRLIYENERMERLKNDYPWRRDEAISILKKEIKNFRDEELDKFISQGIVERRIIEGEERFFSRFSSNIFFLNKNLEKRRVKRDKLGEYTKNLINSAIRRINEGDIAKYKIVAGIKIKIKKRREKYRVWLPVPRLTRGIKKIKILRKNPKNYFLSDENYPQRTIFFESSQREFGVEFEYEIEERKRDNIEEEKLRGEYLGEKLPHVRFTPYLRRLADEIVKEGESDYEKVKRIYQWITKNVNYSYVREYGTYENISEFVATSLRGDCGFHSLLFITLCRIAGIPAKWQSGWFTTPKFASPHDWAEVYIDNKWMPVDCSFGNMRRHGKTRNDFYFGNLDAFRMIANDDFQIEFNPRKLHFRSDPVDNQRGEVEDERANIYYNDFSWEIYVKEFRRI